MLGAHDCSVISQLADGYGSGKIFHYQQCPVQGMSVGSSLSWLCCPTGMADILKAHDWLQYSKITDLHGDSGTFLASVLSAKGHERQQGVLVQPLVLAEEGKALASHLAETYGVSGRMHFEAGDLDHAGLTDLRQSWLSINVMPGRLIWQQKLQGLIDLAVQASFVEHLLSSVCFVSVKEIAC